MKTARQFIAVVCLTALCAGVARAGYSSTNHGTSNSGSAAGGSVTLTLNGTTLSWSYSKNPNGSGDNPAYGLWLASTTGFGGAYGTLFFDVNPSGAVSASGAIGVTAGVWFQIGIRQVTNGNVHDDLWYYQVPTEALKVKISYFNSHDYPVRVRLVDGNGNTIGETTVGPHSGILGTTTLPDGVTSAHVVTAVDGIGFDGTSWVEQAGAVAVVPTGVEVPGVPVPSNEEPAQAVPVPEPPGLPSVPPANPSQPGGSKGGPVWVPTAGTADTERLDKATYRQGVDKLHTKLDDVDTKLEFMRKALGGDSGDFNVEATLAGGAAKANTAAGYAGPKLNQGGSVTVTGSGSGSDSIASWEVTPGHTVALTLQPTEDWSAADTLLRACRGLILLAAVVWFVWSCSKVLNAYVASLPAVPQADSSFGVENYVPGVAQGKTWGSAGAVVGIIVVAVAVMVGVLDVWLSAKGYGISTFFAAVDLGALGSALGLIDRYLPVLAMAQLGILRAGMSFIIGPIYLAAAAAIKFAKA